jgi:hypothetical protein
MSYGINVVVSSKPALSAVTASSLLWNTDIELPVRIWAGYTHGVIGHDEHFLFLLKILF